MGFILSFDLWIDIFLDIIWYLICGFMVFELLIYVFVDMDLDI